MASKPNNSELIYQAYLDRLSPDARAVMSGNGPGPLSATPATISDGDGEYASFLDRLSDEARSAMSGPATAAAPADPGVGRYILVECPDGEWSRPRVFASAEDMARRMGELEGRDVIVWAAYGILLPFTRGPRRYVALPGGGRAISIPLYPGGPAEVVSLDAIAAQNAVEEETGFLGPPELARGSDYSEEEADAVGADG